MKNRTQTVLLVAVLTVIFASANTVSAQPGAYKAVANDDVGVVMAADFAVKTQAANAKTTVTLNRIVKASDQEPKLGARNFMLCLDASVTGTKMFAQAIVTMDQYSNLKLTSWSKSTCGNGASGGMATSGYKPLEKGHAGAGLAADFAVKEQSKVLKTPVDLLSIVKAEMDEGTGKKIGAGTFRLCLIASGKGVGPGSQAIVSMDQYSNLKLISWTPSKCVETDGDYDQVDKAFTVGVDRAADFAVSEHSKDTGVPHKLVKILKSEEKGMFSLNYRICMKVAEEGKTQTIQAIVTRDQYSNHKLVSWEHSTCGK